MEGDQDLNAILSFLPLICFAALYFLWRYGKSMKEGKSPRQLTFKFRDREPKVKGSKAPEESEDHDGNLVIWCLVLGLIVDAVIIYAWWSGEYRGRLSILSLMIFPVIFVSIGIWIKEKMKK